MARPACFAGIIVLLFLTSCSRELTLITYNVGAFGKYTDNSIPEVAAIVREADFVSLNELDSCNRRHDFYQLEALAQEAGGRAFHFAAAFPFAGGAYGNGVLARDGIVKADRIGLPEFTGDEPRSVAVVETRRCVFASTHLDYADPAASLEQARIINDWFSTHYGHSKKPVFLCGDMNAEPGSATLHELETLWECLTPPDPSYPSDEPSACIDYIFHLRDSKPVKVLEAGVLRTYPEIDLSRASDHLPVRAVVRY